MSEAGDLVRGGPELGRGEEVVLEFAQVGVEAVADLHLEQVAEAFDRVEFRAVARQGQQVQVGGEPGGVLRQVAAGLVLDDNRQGGRIGGGDLLEEERVDVPVDGRGEQPFARVGAVDFQPFVQVAPILFT